MTHVGGPVGLAPSVKSLTKPISFQLFKILGAPSLAGRGSTWLRLRPAPTDSPSSDYPLVVKVGYATAATLQRALPMSALPNDAREIVDVPPQAPLEAHDDYAQLVYGGVRYQGLG